MDKVYYSRIDTWLIVVLIISYALMGYAAYVSHSVSVLIFMAVFPFLIFPCKYVLKKDHLFVRCGIIIFSKVNYNQIDVSSIKKTNNPLSAPALSLRRIEIKFKRKRFGVLVSPKNRDAFIEDLRQRIDNCS